MSRPTQTQRCPSARRWRRGWLAPGPTHPPVAKVAEDKLHARLKVNLDAAHVPRARRRGRRRLVAAAALGLWRLPVVGGGSSGGGGGGGGGGATALASAPGGCTGANTQICSSMSVCSALFSMPARPRARQTCRPGGPRRSCKMARRTRAISSRRVGATGRAEHATVVGAHDGKDVVERRERPGLAPPPPAPCCTLRRCAPARRPRSTGTPIGPRPRPLYFGTRLQCPRPRPRPPAAALRLPPWPTATAAVTCRGGGAGGGPAGTCRRRRAGRVWPPTHSLAPRARGGLSSRRTRKVVLPASAAPPPPHVNV